MDAIENIIIETSSEPSLNLKSKQIVNQKELFVELDFKNVSYAYDHGAKNVIEHFNFVLNSGDKVLITGGTGSGKSTVVGIISGLLNLRMVQSN